MLVVYTIILVVALVVRWIILHGGRAHRSLSPFRTLSIERTSLYATESSTPLNQTFNANQTTRQPRGFTRETKIPEILMTTHRRA